MNSNAQSKHPLLLASVIAILVIISGTLGYHFIEGWSLLDSLYMTIISITTVGFSEVAPLSNLGKMFTILLLLSGIGIAAYAFGTGVKFIIEGQIRLLRGQSRMQKKIQSLKGHHIVCGYSRLGTIVVKEFLELGEQVLVLDRDPTHLEELEELEVPLIVGNADEDEFLKKAKIDTAKTLLSLLPNDADNVYVTLCARDLNPEIKITARTDDEDGERRLRRAGATEIISPYRVSGNKVVQRILRPHVSDFLELATSPVGLQLGIEEVKVPENSKIAGKTLQESDLRKKTGAVIAASILKDGTMAYNPGGESILEPGSTLVVLGEKKALERLSSMIAEDVHS